MGTNALDIFLTVFSNQIKSIIIQGYLKGNQTIKKTTLLSTAVMFYAFAGIWFVADCSTSLLPFN